MAEGDYGRMLRGVTRAGWWTLGGFKGVMVGEVGLNVGGQRIREWEWCDHKGGDIGA